MSPFFIEQIKKENKCVNCKASTQEGYKCCPKHLRYAKIRWRNWSAERKLLGRCVCCDKKSFNGWLRCKHHTMENRKRIKAWTALHPNHYREAWEKKKAIRDSGKCPQCPQHRPLTDGHKRCLTCRQRAHLWHKGVKTNKNTPVKMVRILHKIYCR